jgi:hypothetical protein
LRLSRQSLRRMLPSGRWRHVSLVKIEISEERISSIIRIKRIRQLGTNLLPMLFLSRRFFHPDDGDDILLVASCCQVSIWRTKWWIHLKKSKSVHTYFTKYKIRQQSAFITGTQVPHEYTQKCLGITLDAKLQRKQHIKKKTWWISIKFSLSGRNSELSVHNKLTLYRQVIHPVWSYGIQLWGCASDSNIQVIKRYQNKVIKCTVNAL